VEERDAAAGNHEVDGDAVGHGHGEERAGPGAHPAVHTVELNPPAGLAHGLYDNTVDLIAEDQSVEPGERTTKGAPAAHDLTDRRVGPQAQIEPAARVGAATGDAGDDTEGAPRGEVVERDGSGEELLAEHDGGGVCHRRAGSSFRKDVRIVEQRVIPSPFAEPALRYEGRRVNSARDLLPQSSRRSISAPRARRRSSIRS
jgi:hypothetical protein